MKVIGICGSTRVGSNTEILLRETLKTMEKSGAETELILLREKNIQLCGGCDKCSGTGQCEIEDDMQEINEKLSNSDVIIFGSPTYFDNVTGLMKIFMDRTDPLWPSKKLKNKSAGVIVVGEIGPESMRKSMRSIMDFCVDHRMIIKGGLMVKSYKENEIAGKENILEEARKLGKKLLKV